MSKVAWAPKRQRAAGQHDLVEVRARHTACRRPSRRPVPRRWWRRCHRRSGPTRRPGSTSPALKPAPIVPPLATVTAPAIVPWPSKVPPGVDRHRPGATVAVDLEGAGIDDQLRHRVRAQHPVSAGAVHPHRALPLPLMEPAEIRFAECRRCCRSHSTTGRRSGCRSVPRAMLVLGLALWMVWTVSGWPTHVKDRPSH